MSKTIKNTTIVAGTGLFVWWLLKGNKTFGMGTIPGGGAGNTNILDIADSPAKLDQIIKDLEDGPSGSGLSKIKVQGLRVSIPWGAPVTAGLISTINGVEDRRTINYTGTGQSYRIENIYFQKAGALLIVETKTTCSMQVVVTPSGSTTGQVCDKYLFQLTGSQRGYIKQ